MLLQTSAKYLWCPVISHSLLLETLRSNDADGNENVKKKKKKKKKNTSHVHHTFLYISLSFARLRREKPNFALYGGRKQATTKFYFSFWAWISVTRNSASGRFDRLHSVWQSKYKWVGIIALKTERTQIHFLSDMTPCYVLWVVSSSRSWSTRTPLNLLKGTEAVV